MNKNIGKVHRARQAKKAAQALLSEDFGSFHSKKINKQE